VSTIRDDEPVARAVTALVVSIAAGLRRAGLAVSSSETIDAARALTHVDLGRRSEVRAALSSSLVKDDAHVATLDRLLDALLPRAVHDRSAPANKTDTAEWKSAGSDRGGDSDSSDAELRARLLDAVRNGDEFAAYGAATDALERWGGIAGEPRSPRHHSQRVLRGLGMDGLLRELLRQQQDHDETDRRLAVAEAGLVMRELQELIERLVAERISKHDEAVGDATRNIEDLPILIARPDELIALRRAVRPLARKLATRAGRRRRRGRGGLDMRRTIRASIASGGTPLNPMLIRRHPSKPDLVVLCDVSGSVSQFAPFTLSLLHSVHAEFSRVRSWVFIDGIVEVTDLLEESNGMLDARALLSRRGLVENDGRSDYARAIGAFLQRWPDAVSTKTTVLIVGDGRSHDRPSAAAQLAHVRRKARRCYWFNPEPPAEWDTGDSRVSLYRQHVHGMFPAATLRELGIAVEAIA
jgi:uncharacterized protein with von Willebrand factor type A (vWA) domain